MVISRNSQLGLMMEDDHLKVEFLELMKKFLDSRIGKLEDLEKIVEESTVNENGMVQLTVDENDEEIMSMLRCDVNWRDVEKKISACFPLKEDAMNFMDNHNSKLYLICEGVEKCSKMIRIGDNFSSKALRNIQFGKHTYLLGKNEMTRFLCVNGAIKGVYWNREKKIAFEYGFDLVDDGYYFDNQHVDEFNKITKIITFVELGDIEVLMLEKGRNNHKTKKDGKITNTSEYTVYVVDSSWNKLIIRTEGFAVMGHFRLQAYGTGLIDRKLIWINAFEKHGYKRLPKASILTN